MIKNITPLFVFFLLFTACESNPLDVDVSKIEVDLKFHRLDQDLFTAKNEKNYQK